jgi:hypothetical protein
VKKRHHLLHQPPRQQGEGGGGRRTIRHQLTDKPTNQSTNQPYTELCACRMGLGRAENVYVTLGGAHSVSCLQMVRVCVRIDGWMDGWMHVFRKRCCSVGSGRTCRFVLLCVVLARRFANRPHLPTKPTKNYPPAPLSPQLINQSINERTNAQVPLALQVDRLVGFGCHKEALQIAAMFGDGGNQLLLHEIDCELLFVFVVCECGGVRWGC